MTDLMILLFFVFGAASLALAIIAVFVANDAKKASRKILREVRRYLVSGEQVHEAPVKAEDTDQSPDAVAAEAGAAEVARQMAMDLTDAAPDGDPAETNKPVFDSASEQEHSTLVVEADASGEFTEEADVDYVQKVIVNPGQETSSADTFKSLVGMSDFFAPPQVAPVSKE